MTLLPIPSIALAVILARKSSTGAGASRRITCLTRILHAIAAGRIVTVLSTRIWLCITVSRALVALLNASSNEAITAKRRHTSASGAIGATVVVISIPVVTSLGLWIT